MRRSPAVKGAAADALSAIVAQIAASSPGNTKLGIANALRGRGMRARAATQARLGFAAPDCIDADFMKQNGRAAAMSSSPGKPAQRAQSALGAVSRSPHISGDGAVAVAP
jgi:hypothetical protein